MSLKDLLFQVGRGAVVAAAGEIVRTAGGAAGGMLVRREDQGLEEAAPDNRSAAERATAEAYRILAEDLIRDGRLVPTDIAVERFDFRCRQCGHEFQFAAAVTAEEAKTLLDTVVCPKCGAPGD